MIFEDLTKSAFAAREAFGSTVHDSFGSRVLEMCFNPVVEAVARISSFEEQLDAEILAVDKMLQELESMK
ncbi:MAG: hypothetical protein IKJ89_01845 [Kiritimatiellae bacterium]|nr:hypothetical protein [Kiritimatiellia bacterium]